LIQQVQELRDKVESGRITVTIEVMQFLRDWLANHILVQDQAYARKVVK
jgi:hemerythrin